MKNFFKYKVSEVRVRNNIVVIDITPKEGVVFNFRPGQFIMLGIYDKKGNVWQQRPFSICSSPLNKKYLQLAIRVSGEFTKKVATLKKSDYVSVTGPSGFFTFNENKMSDVVFLAGGIGITPFLSAIRYISEKELKNKVTLLYSNRTKEDIIFFEELKSISQMHKNIKIIFILTDGMSEHWQYETKMIDEDMLKKYCYPFKEKYFSLCGPLGFMESMTTQLEKNGVSKDHIDMERF